MNILDTMPKLSLFFDSIHKRILALLILLSSCMLQYAHNDVWSVDPHNYQYHMSIYARLSIDGKSESNTDRYQIGAFVNDECRGIAIPDSAQGFKWLYLRVWSNNLSGEAVSFRIYDKEENATIELQTIVTFEHLGLVGEPSSPKELFYRSVLPGDVNNDGKVAVNDVVLTINVILGNAPDGFIRAAADMNGDGDIKVNDVVLMVNAVLGVANTTTQVATVTECPL